MYTKELRRSARLASVRLLAQGFRFLPESWGRGLCVGIARAGHRLVMRDRVLARRNLHRVHPDWDAVRVHHTARRVFEELGRNVFDFLRYPALSRDARRNLVRFPDDGPLWDTRRRGSGAVLVTAHWGCWEVLAATMVAQGFPFKAMARPLREARLENALARHRRRMGVGTLSSEGLPLAAIRHLKEGGFLGILADQRVKRGGVSVRFLGQNTFMTDGPARLAMAAGVPVIPFGIRRVPGNRHRVEVLDPITPHGSHAHGDPRIVTQAIANSLADLIAMAPEQWMWMHPRWEPIPVDAPGVLPGQARTDRAIVSKPEATCAGR